MLPLRIRLMINSHPYRLLCPVAIVCLAVGVSSKAHADEGAPHVAAPKKTKETYPTQLNLRPLTLFQGMTEATMTGGYWWVDDQRNIAPVSTGVTFGITDYWQASIITSFRLKPDTLWRETVRLATRILAYDSVRVDFAPGVGGLLNFDNAENAHRFPALALDATTRIHVNKHYSLTCGNALIPLSIGRRASLDLNCSLIMQGPLNNFGIRLNAEIFHIRLNGQVRESAVLDNIPTADLIKTIGNWIDLSVTYRTGSFYKGLFGSIRLRR